MKRVKLIEFRGERTQAEMAKLYGVTQQAWWKWENGETVPEPATMLRLEQDSGVSMEQLFFDAFNNLKSLPKGEEILPTTG